IWIGEDSDDNLICDIYELALAEKFCPKIFMHEGNLMLPSPVEVLLDNASICWYLGSSNLIFYNPNPTTSMQDAFLTFAPSWNSHWHLDFGARNSVRDASYWHSYYNSIKHNYQTPTVYSHCFRHDGDFVIQYWFFYPYNDWGADHEGDWEHINVKVSSQNPNNALPLEVVYYFHKKRRTMNWSYVSKDGNHPFVFVGGEFKGVGGEGEEGGGSYPTFGTIANVAGPMDEWIWPDMNRIYTPSDITLINMTSNMNLWWMEFPGHWGAVDELVDTHIFAEGESKDPPPSPPHHECWEIYESSLYANHDY
ncbi:hypothetical protein KAR48_11830, partial [bacterium]|nr:hypothetical protein [bacterium]